MMAIVQEQYQHHKPLMRNNYRPNNHIKNRVGLRSGVTRHFNFSQKRRLFDPVVCLVRNESISKSVESWIKEDPLLLFSFVYQEGKIELAKGAHSLLMDALQKDYPAYYQQIQSRKKNSHRNNKRAQ